MICLGQSHRATRLMPMRHGWLYKGGNQRGGEAEVSPPTQTHGTPQGCSQDMCAELPWEWLGEVHVQSRHLVSASSGTV